LESIHIDDKLLRDARAVSGAATDTEAVRLGLEALLRHAAYERLRALRGSEPTAKEVTGINKTIKDAPAAELAVKSAELVTKAAKKEKEATAVAVVSAAIAKNPASAVTVVSSVIKAAPATAPAVAAAAVKADPDQVESIATAAAKAAPDLADKIVIAIADVYPKLEDRVAKVVMMAVPQAKAKLAKLRVRESGNPELDQFGGQYSSGNTRVDGSNFPIVGPTAATYGSGRDPSRP